MYLQISKDCLIYERVFVMSVGKSGEHLVRINWEQFQKWQRWDEFPERADDPQLIDDMDFYYDGNKYYLDGCSKYGYSILTADWEEIAFDKNLLSLLTKPVFGNESFRDKIESFLFVN